MAASASDYIPGAFNGGNEEQTNVDVQMVAAGAMAANILMREGVQVFRAVWSGYTRRYQRTGPPLGTVALHTHTHTGYSTTSTPNQYINTFDVATIQRV